MMTITHNYGFIGKSLAAGVALSLAAASTLHAQSAANSRATSDPPSNQTTSSQQSSDTPPALLALHTVIVTGTRVKGMDAAQSAAPIQVVGTQALRSNNGAGDLTSALAQTVPSFTMQSFGQDMAGQTLQASLRGLSPNDVLILVNGQRRITTANLEVDPGSIFRGGAGVDLNFIPVAAIQRVEVLTEGAAAQYGSDAEAGVINIILNQDRSGGAVSSTYGQDYDGGGETTDSTLNIGFEPVPGGYLNITADVRNHAHTDVGGPDPQAANLATTHPNSNMTGLSHYPDLSQVFGDAETHTKLVMLNAGLPMGDDVTFYLFGSYGDKNAASLEAYRTPGRISYTNPATGITTYPFLFGFNPQEATQETVTQLNAGFQGTVSGWNWNLGSGYGKDHIKLYTLDSIGSSYLVNGLPTPSDFYDGLLQTTLMTATLDVTHAFDVGLAGPLNVAWGGEFRRDTYQIGAGIPDSYIDGGAQSFPGFTPSDAGDHSRRNEAAYVEFALNPLEPLRLDIAGRHEHYDDFGSATVGKLTARWDFSHRFAIRSTVSSGFRAPTLAEEYYTATNVSPTSATVQLPPNSLAGQILGIGKGLKPEDSTTYSFGLVWRPAPGVITTLDFYQIAITHRVVGSGTVSGQINGTPTPYASVVDAAIAATGAELDPEILSKGSTGITVFFNGIDTRTDGADLQFDMQRQYSFGAVDWSVGATFVKTQLTNTPPMLPALPGAALFNPTAISDLTTASPRYTIDLGAGWVSGRLTAHLTEMIYGPSSEFEGDDGDNATSRQDYFETTIPVTPVTNVELAYRLTDRITAAIGALNAFDRFPPKLNGTLLNRYWRYNDPAFVRWYPGFSPFGVDGGYYYVRASYRF